MVLSAIAALGTIGSAIYSGVQSNRRAKDAQRQLAQMRQDSDSFYRSELARPITTRSDYLSMVAKQRDMLAKQYQRARAASMVAGGTDANQAQIASNANLTLSETTGNYAASSSNRKDILRQQRQASDNAFANQQVAAMSNAADAIANAGGQASKAFAGIASADVYGWEDDLIRLGLRKGKEPTNSA